MLRLDIDRPDGQSGIRSRIENIYDRIAGNDDYQRNEKSLRLIQVCVITVSACATGFVNAFAHKERLGWVGASFLAILITGFVEKFYFALRHGLTTIYKARRQRVAAWLSYRAIQICMTANAGILCTWVVGAELPDALKIYNQWSITIHFMLALFGVSAVRDADAVIEDRIRRLKAEAVEEDIVTIRRAAINDNPLVLVAAKARGFLDGLNLAIHLIRDKPDFSATEVKQIPDSSRRLCLPGIDESSVTGILGKPPAPVNTTLELETLLQSQASSPAQNKAGEEVGENPARVPISGEQFIGLSGEPCEQNAGEQPIESKGAAAEKATNNAHSHFVEVGEQGGEQSPENGECDNRQPLAGDPVGKDEGDRKGGEHSTGESKQRGEQKQIARDDRSEPYSKEGNVKKKGEQPAQVILLSAAQRKRISPAERQTPDEQSALWLKSILPDATNGSGWWEVRAKPKWFALMFRWRAPHLQVITLQGVTRDQLEILKRTGSDDDARDRIREQIAESLRACSLDPTRRDKARVAAKKLGIDLEEHQSTGVVN